MPSLFLRSSFAVTSLFLPEQIDGSGREVWNVLFGRRVKTGKPVVVALSLMGEDVQRLDFNATRLLCAQQVFVVHPLGAHIKDVCRVDGITVDPYFEMQMFCCGTTCPSRKGDRLSSFHPVTRFDQVLGVMAIDRFQAIVVTYHHQIAVGGIGFGKPYDAIECRNDRVVGPRLEVHTGVVLSTASER